MSKGIHLFLVAAMVLIGTSPAWTFSGDGSGTETDPYVITTVEQLQEMQDDLGASYVLGNDIDASNTVTWNGGEGFEPVGYYIDESNFFPFTGNFDGQGYTITNMYINRPTTDGVGVFGYLRDGAEVKNVGLSDADVTAHLNSGTLVGSSSGATVSNSWSSGEIRGSHNYQMRLGGLLGISSDANSYVYQCFSSVNVTATGGAHQIGGLAGYNGHGSIMSDCYATGNVSGYWKVGGLVGDNIDGSEGTVIERCYSAGKVTGNGGGLVGFNWRGGVTRDSYWDVQTSGKSSSYGGTGKTTAQMIQQATFIGWNFNGVWNIDEGRGYPYFHEPGVLENLEIVGPDVVVEDSQAGYRATAHYDNGSSEDVTDLVQWLAWPDAICSIDENGVLSTEILNTPQAQVTVYAAYAEGDIEVDAEKQVKVLSMCPSGSALEFDGVDDYVYLGTDASLDMTNEITISAWIKRPNFNTLGTIVGKNNGNSVTAGYGLFSYKEGLEFNFYSSQGWRRTTPRVTVTTDQWHHVVGTFNGNVLYLYVDGEQKASLEYSGNITTADGYPLNIAYWRSNVPAYFDGKMDDVRIYERALSVEEIEGLYQGGQVDYTGLVGQWNFDEGAGQVAHDSSGNGNDGQLGASGEADDSDPNWVDGGVPRVCTVSQVMRRNLHGAIALKRDAMEIVHEALQKEIATLRMLYRIVRNKDYGVLKKINLLKARKHVFGAIIEEFQAKLKLRKSVEKLKAALRALQGEIRQHDKHDKHGKHDKHDKHERLATGHGHRGRNR